MDGLVGVLLSVYSTGAVCLIFALVKASPLFARPGSILAHSVRRRGRRGRLVLAGAEPTDLSVSISATPDNPVRHYAFTDADGNHRVALWSNGVATDLDVALQSDRIDNGPEIQAAWSIHVARNFAPFRHGNSLLAQDEAERVVFPFDPTTAFPHAYD